MTYLVRQFFYSLKQIATEGAADAPILHFHHLSILLDHLRRLDLLCIKVDLAHIVDDDRHLEFVLLATAILLILFVRVTVQADKSVDLENTLLERKQ